MFLFLLTRFMYWSNLPRFSIEVSVAVAVRNGWASLENKQTSSDILNDGFIYSPLKNICWILRRSSRLYLERERFYHLTCHVWLEWEDNNNDFMLHMILFPIMVMLIFHCLLFLDHANLINRYTKDIFLNPTKHKILGKNGIGMTVQDFNITSYDTLHIFCNQLKNNTILSI